MNWLNRLKSLAQRMCVAPANYAQADLDALHRVGDPGLSSIATNGAGDIVDQLLGITSTRGATLVGDGPLTGPAIQLLASQGPTVAVSAANLNGQNSADGEPAATDVAPVRYTPEVVAAPFDPTVGAALAGVGSDPWTPSYLDPALDIPVKHDSEVARRQDALGSLLWRGLQPDAEPRTQILMPPVDWSRAGRRCGGHPVRGRHHDPGRACRPAAADRGDRREPGGAAAGHPAAARQGAPANPRARFDGAVISGIAGTTGQAMGL